MMSFLARLLRRWGFIRPQDYGLILTDDGRVIPASDLGHQFEPPSWVSVAVPIAPCLPGAVSLSPATQENCARREVTLSAAVPPPPVSAAAPAANRADSEDDEWQWKMALARAKAEAVNDDRATEPDDQPAAEPALEVAPRAAVLPLRPIPARAAPAEPGTTPVTPPGPGLGPRLRAGTPRPRPGQASVQNQDQVGCATLARPPRGTRPSPVGDDTRPDLDIRDFAETEATIDRTIPSAPPPMDNDTHVDIDIATRRKPASLPPDDKPLPRLSAILSSRTKRTG